MIAYNQSIPFGQNDPTVKLNLKMMGKKAPDKEHDYPRISRHSAKYGLMVQDMIFGMEEED